MLMSASAVFEVVCVELSKRHLVDCFDFFLYSAIPDPDLRERCGKKFGDFSCPIRAGIYPHAHTCKTLCPPTRNCSTSLDIAIDPGRCTSVVAAVLCAELDTRLRSWCLASSLETILLFVPLVGDMVRKNMGVTSVNDKIVTVGSCTGCTTRSLPGSKAAYAGFNIQESRGGLVCLS